MRIRNMAVRYCEFLDRKGRAFNIVAGIICAAFLATIDYYSDIYFGVDYTLALFYLMPVAFVAWFAGRNAAIGMALFCILTKLTIQFHPKETLSLLIWINGSVLAFCLVVGILLAKMRKLLDHERALSRTDHLTGAVNRRVFSEVATNEIFRLHRNGQPFTIAYIDLDNFKDINDNYDHSTGDFLLQTVVTTISANLRRTDVVARMGGDEFAILLTNCDENSASIAMHHIREKMHLRLKEKQLAVTFSIGVLTCTVAPQTADEIIALADNLMYEAKRSGKNDIRHAVYARSEGEA